LEWHHDLHLKKRQKSERDLCDKKLCETSSDVNAWEIPWLCLNYVAQLLITSITYTVTSFVVMTSLPTVNIVLQGCQDIDSSLAKLIKYML
jgi:hypothetical protein